MTDTRDSFEKYWKAEHEAGRISKDTLDKLLQKPLPQGQAVAQVHISERSIDLCNNKNTRRLRELIGDGIYNLYLSPLESTALQAGAGDDTARIDYLETLRGDMITGTSDDQELIGHDWVIYGQFYTVREALDYGMMKRQEAIDNAQATEGK